MLNILKSLLGNKVEDNSTAPPATPVVDRVAVATAVISLEMAHADNEFSKEEQEHIPALLQKMFDLSEEESADIITSAEEEIKNSLDLWKFTNIINRNFDRPQKKEIIRAVWQLVYADGTLDKHEDYLMHKLSKLLNMTHRDLIEAKLKVLHGSK